MIHLSIKADRVIKVVTGMCGAKVKYISPKSQDLATAKEFRQYTHTIEYVNCVDCLIKWVDRHSAKIVAVKALIDRNAEVKALMNRNAEIAANG